MGNRSIKAKAMALFVHDGRLLVMPSHDSVKQKPHYRLLGGHIEFGERSEETLIREMLEELGAEIEVLELLAVVQNVFTYEGRQGHEIDFIHHARFRDEAFCNRDSVPTIEAGSHQVNKWLPAAEVLSGSVPLYPPWDYAQALKRLGAA